MGSFGVDITVRFDQAAIQKSLDGLKTKYAAAMKELEAGTEGAGKKVEKVWNDIAKMTMTYATRSGRQIESSIKAVERQAEMAGKAYSEQILIRQKRHIEYVGKDEEAVKRLTTAYQKLYQVQLENERKAAAGPSTGGLLFRGARDIFEGRMSYGVMDLGRAAYYSFMGGGAGGGGGAAGAAGAAGAGATGGVAGLLSTIPAATLAVGGLTAVLLGTTVAGYKAAAAMGEYGHQIREVQNVTGMSVEEVQKMGIAAKLSGRTFEDIEHSMRGFTQAVEGSGSAGQKAAKDFQKMGVDVAGLQRGSVSVYEAFQQIGAALEKNHDVIARNAAMMDILKKSGLADITMFKDLSEAERIASGIHIFTPEEVGEMEKFHRQLVILGIEVKNFFQQMELEIARSWEADVKLYVHWFDKSGKELTPDQKDSAKVAGRLGSWLMGQLGADDDKSQPGDFTISSNIDSMRAARSGRFDQFIASGGGERGLDGARRNLEQLHKAENDLLVATKDNRNDYMKDEAAYINRVKAAHDQVVQQEALVTGLEKEKTARQSIAQVLANMPETVRDILANPDETPGQVSARKFRLSLGETHMSASERAATLQQYMHGRPGGPGGQQDIIDKELAVRTAKFAERVLQEQQTYEREAAHAQLGGVQQVKIRDLGKFGVTEGDVRGDIEKQYQQRIENAQKLYDGEEELIKKRESAAATQAQRDEITLAKSENAHQKDLANLRAQIEKQTELNNLKDKAHEEDLQHAETMSKIQLSDQEEGIKLAAELARKRADLRFKGDSPAAAIAEEYKIARWEAEQEYQLEMRRIELHETGNKKDEDAAQALNKLHREDEKASVDAQYKLAKMQQEQLDNLKGKIEPLYHTLFTDPKNFGKQLRSTVTEAALHPIVSGLSEATAKVLYPAIYGSTGTGGLAGIFGGGHKLSDITLLPDRSVPVTIVNNRTGGYSSGGGGTYIAGGGGIPGFTLPFGGGGGGGGGGTYVAGGGGIPGFTLPAPFLGLPSLGSGGTASFASGGLGGGGTAGGGGFNVSPLLGLARGLSSGWKQMLGLAKPSVPGETPGSESMARAAAGLGVLGHLKGFAASPLAKAGFMTGGSMAAQAGLLGQQRGTAGGVVMGTLGGAAMGAAIAPGPLMPLGAAIGAAAGLGIGLGEVIAGVESPRHQAQRLAKSIYHITVSNSAADQIVATANQSYAGNVSIAMRSPEVRHMLGLYAAGTSQGGRFSQSSNDPHGASLVESGGSMYQQATYEYGASYTQRSPLPVYGGQSSNVIGPPGAPGIGIPPTYNLSLNIGGADAAKFMTGQVVSPDVIQNQYQTAMSGSNGRVNQALMMSEPGSIAG